MWQPCGVSALPHPQPWTEVHDSLVRVFVQAVKEHLMPITGPETEPQQPCLMYEHTAQECAA